MVGGGLVGLATARALQARGERIVLCEKEDRWAAHQSGHNSGVVHSGLYYPPGGLKATMATRAAAELGELCAQWGVGYRRTGKLVVAVRDEELPRMHALAERGRANGVPLREISPAQAREIEPHIHCVGALRVASTGVCDFPALARALADQLTAGGADLRLSTAVTALAPDGPEVRVGTTTGELRVARVVNCAGLYSDRLLAPEDRRDTRIVPFRGEYWALRPASADLVGGLVYPVPDPDLPFLGVHLTRGIDGTVHLGPNAILALSREGYRWRDVSARDLADTLGYPGFWRMTRKNLRAGIDEFGRSIAPPLLVRAAQQMLPELTRADLIRYPAGVRAQAVGRDGRLSDDFVVQRHGQVVHVINAPSPAATAALQIGERIASLALAEAGG